MNTLFGPDSEEQLGAADGREARDPRRPLAARLRPTSLDEFVGQSHLLGPGSALRTAIDQGKPHSMLLYGPPGSGKTTLARILANRSQAAFEELSAVQAGRAEVRAVLERATHRREMGIDRPTAQSAGNRAPAGDRASAVGQPPAGTETVFFLDEIHRFNKAQQDALLPAVEEGLLTLIGATTENPAFEVNGALLSRMRVYALAPLTPAELKALLRRALARAPDEQGDREGDARAARAGRPAAAENASAGGPANAADLARPVAEEALDFLAARSDGDARIALNALELASATAAELGEAEVTLARAEDALQRRAILYDKKGDRHYDFVSAWIKATRGSDPDASLYYLAAMLEGGEDPRFIARRMVILASEDIGNADPGALALATSAARAVDFVGLPEARYALAQAAIYLSLAPKSNAAGRALAAAESHLREHGAAPVPGWLLSGPRPARRAPEQEGYDYPHDRPGHLSPQELLPEGVVGARFYEPDAAEAELVKRLELIRRRRGREQR
jgi:putative ATPase